MPGGLERQNAFSEYNQQKPFIELQCHICAEYEYDGDWIKIKCPCTDPYFNQYVYTHKHCLKTAKKCKKCDQPFTVEQNKNKKEFAPLVHNDIENPQCFFSFFESMQKHYYNILLVICLLIGLSIIQDALGCITVDLLDGEELQGLTDADYLYLPVSQNIKKERKKEGKK